MVREAAVFCDSFSLLEIVWRILLITTLVSVLVPVISVGAFFEVVELVELADVEGAAFCGAAGAAFGGSALAGAGVYGAAYITYIIIK